MKNNTNFSVFNDYQTCNITNGIIRYFGTFIFIVGIVSTLLSACVFARKPLRRKSCCFYFLVLAISDSIHLLTMIIENLPYSFHVDLIVIHTSICKIIIFLIYFSNHLSNIVLTLASLDRFILIYCPSRSKVYCNIRKAKCFVLISIIILGIANGHILFGYERIHLYDEQSNESFDCNIHQNNILYKNLFRFYDSYIESIFFVIIPFFIMSICSILIIVQIFETRKTIRYNTRGKFYYYTFHTSEKIRQTVKKKINDQGSMRLRDKDIQLCCMLIGTTLAFLFLCLPTEINDLFNYTGSEQSCFHWFRKVILMLMQQIYYAGHFYIYTLTGQLFRKHLYAIFSGRNNNQPFSNLETQSLLSKALANLSDTHKKNQNRSSIREHNGAAKSSLTTTSFINTTSHRPATTVYEITQIPTNDNSPSADPSQQLLSYSNSITSSY